MKQEELCRKLTEMIAETSGTLRQDKWAIDKSGEGFLETGSTDHRGK